MVLKYNRIELLNEKNSSLKSDLKGIFKKILLHNI